MPDALIVDAVRSPIGKKNGTLASVRADELAGQVLNGLVERVGIEPAEIEDVQMGCVSQVGEQALNVGRSRCSSRAGPKPSAPPPPTASAARPCRLRSTPQPHQAGHLDAVVAAGVENMSRVPMGSNLGPDGFAGFSEKLFERWEIVPRASRPRCSPTSGISSREALDAYSYESHKRAIAAIDEGRFEREIVPVEVQNPHVGTLFAVDETPRRDTSLEKLAELASAFKQDGVVTAGSSSQICDGAAAMLVVSEDAAERLELEPRARFVSFGLAGVDPYRMLHGNPQACERALSKAGLSWDDMAVIEVNEAFASVALQFLADTGLEERWRAGDVNPNGGGISLGHPLGATGARITATLLAELERRGARYGVATMCIGQGKPSPGSSSASRGFSSLPPKPMTSSMVRMLLSLARPLPRGRLALLHGPR